MKSGHNLVNFVLFQTLWFACVVGAADNRLWPGVIAFILLLLWQSIPSHRAKGDAAILLIAAVIGVLLDSLWQFSGLLVFELSLPLSIAPVWIVLLWMGLALTLNHSLAWLKLRPLLSAAFSAMAAPCSYYAAYRLGAVQFAGDSLLLTLLLLSLAWAVVVPLLFYLLAKWTAAPANRFVGVNIL